MYLYDGTQDGLFCCVFESFSQNELPAAIFSPDSFQYTLYPAKEILTDPARARRVAASIPAKISREALELTSLLLLTCHPERELLALRFLRLGYQVGAKVCDMLQDDTVHELHKAIKNLQGEAHLLKEFLRFVDTGAGLVAKIKPHNLVLPLMRAHFCDRYTEESFLIFDLTHGMALVYRPYESRIIPAEWVEMPPENEQEAFYRQLWQRFYVVAGVEERFNPACRRNHMAMRYWDCLTEYDQLLLTQAGSKREAIGPAQGIALPGGGVTEYRPTGKTALAQPQKRALPPHLRQPGG